MDQVNKKIAFIFIFIFLFSFFSRAETGKTRLTHPIVGFAPYMNSIGSIMNPENIHAYDSMGNPISTVYAQLYVPSILCKMTAEESDSSPLKAYFDFRDKDGEQCNKALLNGLKWYLIEPNVGGWETVSRWDDLKTTEINNQSFPGSILPDGIIKDSAFTAALKIPKEALGKRIGFTYQPVTVTGVPQEGSLVKVWDLDYFFGQYSLEPSISALQNEGRKLERIPVASGGGVIEEFTRPVLKNPVIKGTFGLNERLALEYDFYSMDTLPFEDVSRIWWGKEGTTKALAYFENPEYSNDLLSPPLTVEDLGSIYEVSILPIKKENERFVLGAAVYTLKTTDSNNQLMSALSITDLAFTDKIRVGQPISATYTFNHDGVPSIIDQSLFEWGYRHATTNKFMPMTNGVVTISGLVPDSPVISHDLAGRIIELRVTPKDNLNRIGETVVLSNETEALVSLQIEPRELVFILGNTQTQPLVAMGEFSLGSRINLTEYGIWSADDSRVTITKKGEVSIQGDNTETFSSKVKFKYNNETVSADVSVVMPPSLSLNIINDHAITNEEYNIIEVLVTDHAGTPMSDKIINVTTSNTQINVTPPVIKTDGQGKARVSLFKTPNETSQEKIDLSIEGYDVSSSIQVTFLGVVSVHQVKAPKDKVFLSSENFPTTGFSNATFEIIAHQYLGNNAFTWKSSNPSAAPVDSNGKVTLNEASHKKSISITAKGSMNAHRYTFTVQKWFSQPFTTKYDPGKITCENNRTEVPTRSELSSGENVRGIGSLWAEWHKPDSWNQAVNSHYWSNTESQHRKVYVIDIYTGSNTKVKANDGAYIEHMACVKR